MAQIPKRVKYRKSQRGNRGGNADSRSRSGGKLPRVDGA